MKSQVTQEAIKTIKERKAAEKKAEREATVTHVQKKTGGVWKNFTHWLESAVVPFIANVILVALALKGTMQFLPTLNSSQQLAGGVIVVALLAYVAYKRK